MAAGRRVSYALFLVIATARHATHDGMRGSSPYGGKQRAAMARRQGFKAADVDGRQTPCSAKVYDNTEGRHFIMP